MTPPRTEARGRYTESWDSTLAERCYIIGVTKCSWQTDVQHAFSDCLAWFQVAVKMPDSSPLEELTAGETNSGHIGYQCQGRQPLQEAEAILADQLREVR